MCLRGECALCRNAQARCGHACHGAKGQQPPPPNRPRGSVPEPRPDVAADASARSSSEKLVPSSPEPASSNGVGHACPECGRSFAAASGLGRHRSTAHGVAGKSRAIARNGARPPARPKLDTASVEQVVADDGYDPWVLVVGDVDHGSPTARAAILSTRGDVDQVAALLVGLGHRPFVFRVADGTRP
jgi:hypothetical protein